MSVQYFSLCGEILEISARVISVRVIGGGLMGVGCVGQV
jgi:hypothetical protein